MPQGPYDVEVMRERVRLLFDHLPFVLGGNLVTSTLVVLLLWNSAPGFLLVAWLLVVWLITARRWDLRQRFLAHPAAHGVKRWANVYTLFAGVSGCIWGLAGIVFFQPEPFVLVT